MKGGFWHVRHSGIHFCRLEKGKSCSFVCLFILFFCFLVFLCCWNPPSQEAAGFLPLSGATCSPALTASVELHRNSVSACQKESLDGRAGDRKRTWNFMETWSNGGVLMMWMFLSAQSTKPCGWRNDQMTLLCVYCLTFSWTRLDHFTGNKFK